MSTALPPLPTPHNAEEAHAYFEAIRPWVLARRGGRGYRIVVDEDGIETVVEDEIEVEAEITVLEPGRVIDRAEYTQSMNQIAKRVEVHGWEVMVKRSRFHVGDVPYVTDEKDGKYNRGDVKTPEHDAYRWAMLAVRYNEDGDQAVMALHAGWEQSLRPSPTTGKLYSPTFEGADTYDPILGREWRGRFQEPRIPYVGERVLALPLKSWLQIVAPIEGETRKKPQTEKDLLNGGDWNG